MGRYTDPRFSLDAVVKRKSLSLTGNELTMQIKI
jgi:hypothetical protein